MGPQGGFRSGADSLSGQLHESARIANVGVTYKDSKVRVLCTPATGAHADEGLLHERGVQPAHRSPDLVARSHTWERVIGLRGHKEHIADILQITLWNQEVRREDDLIRWQVFEKWNTCRLQKPALRSA